MSTIEIEGDGTDMFVRRNGVRIAKRTPSKTWLSLEPGFTVYDNGAGELTIDIDPPASQ